MSTRYEIIFRQNDPDGYSEEDITELVQTLFDLANSSMDHGSGFYEDEDEKAIAEMAVLMNVDESLMCCHTRDYLCRHAKGGHAWQRREDNFWVCSVCDHRWWHDNFRFDEQVEPTPMTRAKA